MFDNKIQKASLRISISVIIITFLAFCLIAWDVFGSRNLSIDKYFAFLHNTSPGDGGTKLMSAISILGSSPFLFPAYLLLVCVHLFSSKYRDAILIAVTGLGAFLLSSTLKTEFFRQRPVHGLVVTPTTFSFPSGHSTSSMTFFVLLAFYLTRHIPRPASRLFIFLAAVGIAGTIGYSRIYLNLHYPSDVLAGFCLALCWLSVMWIVYSKIHNRDSIESRRFDHLNV